MKEDYFKLHSASGRPCLAGKPNPACPILIEARIVLDKTQDLRRSIRRLRQSTQRCLTCPERLACPTVCDFSLAVDHAIRELWAEWGLGQE